MASEILLKLQKYLPVDPDKPPFLGGEISYDDARYENLRSLRRFKPSKKEEEKKGQVPPEVES